MIKNEEKTVADVLGHLGKFSHPAEQDHYLASDKFNLIVFAQPVEKVIVKVTGLNEDKKTLLANARKLVGVDFDEHLDPIVALVGDEGKQVKFTLGRQTEVFIEPTISGFELVILNQTREISVLFKSDTDAHKLRNAIERIKDVLI